ncbi:endonuclease MutS2 [Eupransor demetentiae]|uniref:Endonuclease MutS2 n=1 Tax=Eupransor demetentiae TaxID=3109584 RepID=A0ABM9N612_9LACO|nr:dsDNA-specific endonuclease/ATPase MutS2 (MutS2) [Lactobacillaceae bacterium LMG 33000]
MNKKVLETLEYDKVKGQLRDYLATELGEAEYKNLQPSSDRATIQKWLDETAEGVMIDRLQGGIPLSKLNQIDVQLKRLRIQAALSGTEIANLAKILQNTAGIAHFFEVMADESIGESVHILPEQAAELAILPALTRRITTALDDQGHLNDEASSTLASLRGKIVGHENAIKAKMQNHLKGKNAQYLSDPIMTMRGDRYVLPVKAEYRHRFSGVVHDQSQSGLTYYIEPQDVVEISNQLSELQVQAAAEEQKILGELSQELGEHVDELHQNAQILGHFDFVNAKARLAAKLDAMQPVLSDDEVVDLKQAWHPLLAENIAVKNDIALGQDYDTLIITGPNTGGKTITIKTLGILQLMAQSGLFITTRQPSKVAVFDQVFADIGDEQSIEQNLSTFSSHMKNIRSMLPEITDKTLVIFDELGAGTDPAEGAALAMAILDKVASLGAKTIATTHYPELKLYAFDRDRTSNASMIFDVQSLKPTYKLLTGVPGQSNAIAIAKRLGFGDDILGAAKSMTSKEDQSLNQMITDLVKQRDAVRDQSAALTKERAALSEKNDELDEEKRRLDKEQAKLVLDAKKEANHIVASTKKEAEQLISEIRKERLRAGQSGGLSEQDLQKKRKAISGITQNEQLERNRVLQKAKKVKQLAPGDEVTIQSYGQQATLVKKHNNNQWEVEMGILKMLVDEDDIVKSQGTVKAQATKKKQRKKIVKTTTGNHSKANVQSRLDLRGVRYDDALRELDRYLDTAVMSNLSPVEIIHGKGTGALRKGVTQFLRSDRRVADYHFASANAGGDGATIVNLK